MKDTELQEMAKRLERSQQDLLSMFQELAAEQVSLQNEKVCLHDTISLMMQELQKLKIGADNTVEPMLDEGPLDFVGRFWEKVRPRDTAYVVNEHVGEIRKEKLAADGKSGGSSPVEIGRQMSEKVMQAQVVQQAQERGKQVVQKLSGTLAPWWQRAEGLISQAQDEITGVLARTRRSEPKTNGYPEAPQSLKATEPAREARLEAEEKAETPVSEPAAAAAAAPVAVAEPAAAVAAVALAAAPAAVASEAPAVEATAGSEALLEDPLAATEPAAASSAAVAPAAAAPQETATILIEAKLTLDDGTVQTLVVQASDRTKEVAHRFVQEHSLKAWYEKPLTEWLKKVEADAVKFPVIVDADLMEIRKTFSKK